MDVGFRETLNSYTKDGYLDKSEIEGLRAKAKEVQAKTPYSADAVFSKNIMSNVDRIKDKTLLQGTIFAGKEAVQLKFEVVPTYSEKEKINATNIHKALEKITQGDAMNETTTDDVRCGTASIVDIALRSMANKNPSKTNEKIFSEFATKVGVSKDFTFENVHKAQDKLHLLAKNNVSGGLIAGYTYSYSPTTDKISNVETTGDVKKLTDLLGLKTTTLLGATKATINDKKSSVDTFLKENPKASILIGVYMNEDGDITQLSAAKDQNHFVEVYQKDGGLYIHNTGLLNNNDPNVQDKKLTPDDIKSFLYTNPGTTLGIA